MLTYKDLMESHPTLFNNENVLIEIVTDENETKKWVSKRKKQLLEQDLPEDWAEIGVVYEDPYIMIIRDLVRLKSGRMGSYFRLTNSADLRGGKGTVILPLFRKKILIMRQFRHPTREWHWEIPRGFGEPNTPPAENAKKEIFEEIQGEISRLVDLGPYHSNTGIEGASVQLFLADLKSIGNVNQDEGIKSYKLVAIDEFERMIRDAKITDGFTIAAYTRARLNGLL